MRVVVSGDGGFPSYPFRKVVIAGERAEVAEVSCDGEGSENVVRHEDLVSRLRDRAPELVRDTGFTAGWITQSGDEAFLSLHLTAGGISDGEAARYGRALSEWCGAAGIRRLTIADASRRRSAASGESDWSLE